jgi:hypothetical protein
MKRLLIAIALLGAIVATPNVSAATRFSHNGTTSPARVVHVGVARVGITLKVPIGPLSYYYSELANGFSCYTICANVRVTMVYTYCFNFEQAWNCNPVGGNNPSCGKQAAFPYSAGLTYRGTGVINSQTVWGGCNWDVYYVSNYQGTCYPRIYAKADGEWSYQEMGQLPCHGQ